MNDKFTTVWVSKYALTEGVRAKRAELCGNDMVDLVQADGSRGWGYLHKGDWHLSKDDADQKTGKLSYACMDSFGREETKPDYSCHAWKCENPAELEGDYHHPVSSQKDSGNG